MKVILSLIGFLVQRERFNLIEGRKNDPMGKKKQAYFLTVLRIELKGGGAGGGVPKKEEIRNIRRLTVSRNFWETVFKVVF